MKKFMIDLLERALKTAAQAALATIGTSKMFGEVDWRIVISTVGMACVLSVLTSLASRNVGDSDSAGMIAG